MKKPTIREVRAYLEDQSPEELIEMLLQFYKKFDGVKENILIQMGNGSNEELLEKQRAIIQREFFPSRGFGQARLSIARKAVTDYKKLSPNIEGLINLMVFYVEMGVRYTNSYGDINEAFYNSMIKMYENALKLIVQYKLYDQFQVRCKRIVRDTFGIGWGFHDDLSYLYTETFEKIKT
jgi:hypothetical protein